MFFDIGDPDLLADCLTVNASHSNYTTPFGCWNLIFRRYLKLGTFGDSMEQIGPWEIGERTTERR